VILYLPALGYDFVRDDHSMIERNPFMRREGWLGKLLISDFWSSSGGSSGLWRPLVILSYWLEGRLAHFTPALFHAVNLLLHAGAAAWVAALLVQCRVPRAAALMGSLWFAAMPAHVESVAWIAGRTDVLCAAFFLLALWLDRRARAQGRSWPGPAAVGSLALALASKEAAVPFALVAAVADRVERPEAPPSARLRWLSAYAGVTALYVALHARWASAVSLPAYIDAALRARRSWGAWTMLPGYLSFLWPWVTHSPDRAPALPRQPFDFAVMAGAALLLGVGVLTVALALRSSRVATPLACFWMPLLPSIGMALSRGYVAYAERLVYLPSAGAAWLLGLGLGPLLAPRADSRPVPLAGAMRWIAGSLAAVMVVGSAAETARILPDWRNDGTMYRAMARAQPRNAMARVGLAEVLQSQGREAEALEELRAAESLDPRLPEVQVSRAGYHLRRGEWSEVLARSRLALASDSTRAEARLLEATALLRLRRLDEARERLARLRAGDPADPAIESLWGQLLMLEGRFDEALPPLERASRWTPDDPSLAFALGNVSLRLGRAGEARAAFERTVAIDSRYYDGWLRLALACHLLGDSAARDAALERASLLPESRDGRVAELRSRLVPGARGATGVAP